MKTYDIYEEGFVVMECAATAHYIGSADGEDFLDACKHWIEATGIGSIKKDANAKEYACDWGCRWFPSLAEAQSSFG